jgi:A/G-specific adenine glycosylase
VLDANVVRVLMRVLGVDDDPKLKAAQVLLKRVSLDLCALGPSGGRAVGGPRDLNLAMMDLGATVCLPQSPRCGECPVAGLCQAKAFEKQEDIPMKTEKAERPTVRRLHAILEWKGKWLMGRRPEGGLFGGLWEFPGIDAPEAVEPVLALEQALRRETGLILRVREALPAFEHQLTHRVFSVRSFLCKGSALNGSSPLPEKGEIYTHFRWISPAGLSAVGISSITRRIHKLVIDASGGVK